jgi:spore photoproduct lyase
MSVQKLMVERGYETAHLTRAIQGRLGLRPRVVDDKTQIFRSIGESQDPVQAGKRTLLLTGNRGRFVRDCPGTRHYHCCGYRILHVGSFCSMDCSYCILQSYFHPPLLQLFVNTEDMAAELEGLFEEYRVSRVGTGEFTDSLIWNQWSELCPELVTCFGRQRRAVLELKTKTTLIEGLEHLAHHGKTVMAWSVNTDKIVAEEERGTASLDARLRAARSCAEQGYPLAFHFDPIIIYEGCRSDYRRVVDRIAAAVPAERIAWISLGSLRFMPALKAIIQQRFANSRIVYGEFVRGLDGKMRYFKPLRIRLYRDIAERIRLRMPETLVYYCMEDDEVWRRTLGFAPQEKGGLARMLDERAVRVCDLDHGLLTQSQGLPAAGESIDTPGETYR